MVLFVQGNQSPCFPMRYVLCWLSILLNVSRIFSQGYPIHEGNINKVVFTNDSRFLLTGSDDGTAKIWEVPSGKKLYTFIQHFPVTKIFINQDNTLMVTGDEKGHYCMWDVQKGEQIKCLLDKEVHGFTPDGKKIIISTYENTLQGTMAKVGLLDVVTQERVYFPWKFHPDSTITDIECSKDNNLLFVMTGDRYVREINRQDPKIKTRFKLPYKVDKIFLSPDLAKFVVSGHNDIYSLKTGKKIGEIRNNGGMVFSEYIFQHDNTIVGLSEDGGFVFDRDCYELTDTLFTDASEALYYFDHYGEFVVHKCAGDQLTLGRTDSEERIHLFDPALQLKLGKINFLSGVFFYKNQEYDKALQYLNYAQSFTPEDYRIYYYRGKALADLGFKQGAINEFQKSEELSPGSAMFEMTKLASNKNETKPGNDKFDLNCKVSYAEFLIDPSLNIFSGFYEWEKYTQNKKKESGCTFASQAIQRFNIKDYPGALEFINRAIAVEPGNPDWYEIRANIFKSTYEFSKAVKDLDKSALIDTTRKTRITIAIANVYLYQGDPYKALTTLETVAGSDDEYVFLFPEMAELAVNNHHKDAALHYLDRYLEFVHVDHQRFYLRATLQDNQDDAKQDLKRAREICDHLGIPIPAEYHKIKR